MALVLTINGGALPAGVKLLYKSTSINKAFAAETFEFKVYDPDRVTPYRPIPGDTARIAKDGGLLAGGEIIEVVDSRAIDPDGGGTVTLCRCRDWSFAAEQIIPAQYIITAGTTATAAFAALISGYMTARGWSDITAGTGPALPEMKFDHQSIRVIFDAITKASGWPWRVNGDKQAALVLPGSLAAPYAITNTNGNTVGGLSWSKSRAGRATRVMLLSGGDKDYPASTRTESWVGNGVRQVFYLAVEPSVIPTEVVVGGVPTPMPSATWTYNALEHAIVRASPLPNAVTLAVTFATQTPSWVRSADASAFTTAGTLAATNVDRTASAVEQPAGTSTAPKTTTDTDAMIQAALNWADYERELTIGEPKKVTVSTMRPGFYPLQSVSLTFADRGITGTYLIQDVKIVDVGIPDTQAESLKYTLTCIEGGDLVKDWRDYFIEKFGGSGGGGGSTVGSSGGGSTGGGSSVAAVRIFAGGNNDRGVTSTSWANIPMAVPFLIGGPGWPTLTLKGYTMVTVGGTSIALRVVIAPGEVGAGTVLATTSPVSSVGGFQDTSVGFTAPTSSVRCLVEYQISGTVNDAFVGMVQIEG